MRRPGTLRRSSCPRGALVALALALAGFGPSAAQAQAVRPAPEVDVDEARRHFQQGVILFNDGNLEAALEEFNVSHRLNPLPLVLYNIALVERDLHRNLDAARTLGQYLEEGVEEPPQRRAEAEEILGEVEALLASVTIGCDRPGADLFVDGELAGRTPVDQPLWLEAGRHELELRLDGYETFRQGLEVRAGQRLELGIELRPLRRPWYRTWWFWTVVGVVAVGTTAGVVGGVLSRPEGADFEIEVVAGETP